MQGSETAGRLGLVLKFAALAVAATIAAPSYSASVEESDIARVAALEEQTTPSAEVRARALQVLIEETWVAGEAKERGIVVTDAQVDDAIGEEFSPRELKVFLKQTGMTRTLLRKRVRSVLESNVMREQVTEPAAKSVTPDQVKAYVDANPIIQPDTRTVRIVVDEEPESSGGHRQEAAPRRDLGFGRRDDGRSRAIRPHRARRRSSGRRSTRSLDTGAASSR